MSHVVEEVADALPQTGSELRGLREAAGIQQQVLAQTLEIDRTSLSQIEAGFKAMPPDLPARYVAEVQRIARERAEAVGAVPSTEEPAAEQEMVA